MILDITNYNFKDITTTNINDPTYTYHKLLTTEMDYINFDDKYIYRPDLVAFHVYNDQSLFTLIMSVNNIESIIQFTPTTVGDKIFLPQNLINIGVLND